MACYLQLSSEENLLISILDGVWGSKTNKMARWQAGDQMIVYVERALAARFTISGEPYYDTEPIWPGELYPYRVPVRLDKIVAPAHRFSLNDRDVRKVLHRHHSTAYGVALVLGAMPLADVPCRLLMDLIDQSPAWENFNATQALRALQAQQAMEQSAVLEEVVRSEPPSADDEGSPHTQMQFYLAQLGQALHFQVWIPKADQGREFHGTRLGEVSLSDLPPLPFSEPVLRIVRNIDVIWLLEGSPAHAFEVEHTTTVYSGLLRMSDLTALIPAISIGMFICARTDRKDKVRAEVNRPTFARRSLAERCRFIPFEKLADFMESQRDYLGHFNTSILDELSESLGG